MKKLTHILIFSTVLLVFAQPQALPTNAALHQAPNPRPSRATVTPQPAYAEHSDWPIECVDCRKLFTGGVIHRGRLKLDSGNNDDTLAILEEVDVDSLKVGLDLPLFESHAPEDVTEIVHKIGDLMVYSHTISLAGFKTVGGAPYGWEEVTPGSELDPLPWETFFEACKDIGYNGVFSHEQCSPIITKGHQLGDLATIDERYVEARNYFRPIFTKLDCYSGDKPEFVEYVPA